MRVFISKPVNGLSRVRLDDRRGITAMRKHAEGVKVADVEGVVSEMVEEWSVRRKSIYAAKKAK